MRKDKISNVSNQINKLMQSLDNLREEIWEEQLEIDPKNTDKIEEHTEAMKNINSMITHVENTMKIVKKRLESPLFQNKNISKDIQKQKNEKPSEKIHLSKHIDLKFKKPLSVEFFGKKQRTRSWRKWAVFVINELIENNKIRKQELLKSKTFWGTSRHYFQEDTANLSDPKLLNNGLYMETKFSANDLRDIVIDVLDIADVDSREVIIYLKR